MERLQVRALIVEDHRAIQRDLKETLEELGHDVCGVASNRQAATELIVRFDPEIVLLDISLEQGDDGIEIGKVVRERGNAVLVFVTADAEMKTLSRAGTLRPNGYLLKPFNSAMARATILTAIANHNPQTEMDAPAYLAATHQIHGLSIPQLRRVEAYIESNLERMFKTEELADLLDLGPDHFARCFKKSTGQSPHQHVVRRRMDEACRLLRETDLSMLEVGLSVGYSTASHFSKSFKDHIGMTPREFRKL